MNERNPPGWAKSIAAARKEWWARLADGERAEARAAIQSYRRTKREKAKQRIERMRRILAAYNSGMTADEIGAAIGMGGKSVREFAARRG
jgi:t-SNARE complex subunit (syntaxin)